MSTYLSVGKNSANLEKSRVSVATCQTPLFPNEFYHSRKKKIDVLFCFIQVSSDRKGHFVRTLVKDVGIDVNYSPYPGLTALYIACKYHNSTEVIEELLGLGARVNDTADGKRPIDVLIEYGNTEVTYL